MDLITTLLLQNPWQCTFAHTKCGYSASRARACYIVPHVWHKSKLKPQMSDNKDDITFCYKYNHAKSTVKPWYVFMQLQININVTWALRWHAWYYACYNNAWSMHVSHMYSACNMIVTCICQTKSHNETRNFNIWLFIHSNFTYNNNKTIITKLLVVLYHNFVILPAARLHWN